MAKSGECGLSYVWSATSWERRLDLYVDYYLIKIQSQIHWFRDSCYPPPPLVPCYSPSFNNTWAGPLSTNEPAIRSRKLVLMPSQNASFVLRFWLWPGTTWDITYYPRSGLRFTSSHRGSKISNLKTADRRAYLKQALPLFLNLVLWFYCERFCQSYFLMWAWLDLRSFNFWRRKDLTNY